MPHELFGLRLVSENLKKTFLQAVKETFHFAAGTSEF
jgi:hypothetical protein